MKWFRSTFLTVCAVMLSVVLMTGTVGATNQVDSQQDHNVYQIVKTIDVQFGQSDQSIEKGINKFNDWDSVIEFYNKLKNNSFEEFNQNKEQPIDKPVEEELAQEEPAQEEPAQEEPVQEEPEVEENKSTVEQPASSDLHDFEMQVFNLVNQERESRGLAPLEISVELSNVARQKSQDMGENNYFSHQSPTYGSPFDMMDAYGIQYRSAGENIAMGQRSPEQVMNGWMNSDGHRANILSENFTHIGVGYVEHNGTTYWTQMFKSK
ncbi:CAP domain-containing protein [Halalkalibacillus halophilus]|uniref:CAP domain-containing protein n=1 Tax=Halalkalibacillus halophilus TaxID=392827 RepID=UPI0003FEC80D|nr:CAP domain-containing protein [Halalkalibacillus halophilus]